jgi:pimeloyl-ACP methyl ester carboxylesterase
MTAGLITGALVIALALIVAAIWVLGSRAKKRIADAMTSSGGNWFASMRKESTAIWDNLAAARAMQLGSLGDMPLLALSRGLTQMSTGPGVSAEDVAGYKTAEDEMQAELAALSTRGKQIIAADCGHHIHVERPQLVIDAIREVVEALRAER